MTDRTLLPLLGSVALGVGLLCAVACDSDPSSAKVGPEAASSAHAQEGAVGDAMAQPTSMASAAEPASASSTASAPAGAGASAAPLAKSDELDDLDDLDLDDDAGPRKLKGKKSGTKKGLRVGADSRVKAGAAGDGGASKGTMTSKAGSASDSGKPAGRDASSTDATGTAVDADGKVKSGAEGSNASSAGSNASSAGSNASSAGSKPQALAALEPALPGSADAVAEKVDVSYGPVDRFRARFEQHYTAKIAGTIKKSSGVVYIKRPSKISFSYREPNKNRVVSDGVTLKIFEHENNQMFLKPVAQTEYPGALAFIMGKGLRHSFRFAFHSGSKWEGGPVLVGTPRTPNAGYEKVLFYIDEELLNKGDPACVRRVLVIDAQGNKNRFDFIHVEVPDSIGDAEFTFEPPPGTTIIK
ncbi:MAG: outer membrane lipoprotein carrier protein LolA [Myxococcales bacterium]|nr:outer membrane lipoprotein carrier protein LolA [Myxococcales bacterium]